MVNEKQHRIKTLIAHPVILSVFACAAAWFLTALLGHLIWKNPLPDFSLTSNLMGFLLPLAIVFFSSIKVHNFNLQSPLLQIIFAGILLSTCVLVFGEKIVALRAYGDSGQVGKLAADGSTYSRWLVGSSLITFIFQKIIHPLFENLGSLEYVKIFGSLLMCLTSVILIHKYPKRLSVILPLFTPIWLLFAWGYDEYYPFIAPVFLLFLILISEDFLSRIHPLAFGFFTAFVGLLYAGFVPMSLFLLFVFFLRRGWKQGVIAAGAALVSAIFLIWIFWPSPIQNFFPDYYSKLNLKDSLLYPGMNITHTPFFKFKYAFSLSNINRVVYSQFWTGGFIAPLFILAGLFSKRFWTSTKHELLTALFLGLFMLWQVFYFVFMIPRLGVIQDIDLFFTVYLTMAYIGGWVVDKAALQFSEDKANLLKRICFSAFLGNSMYAGLYLILLGLPVYG